MAAQALSWRWSSVRSASADQPAIRASGRFNTGFSQDQAGFPTIQSLSGQRNGIPITSFLATGSSIPGNCIPSTCFKGDNLVRQPGGAAQLTSHGLVLVLPMAPMPIISSLVFYNQRFTLNISLPHLLISCLLALKIRN